MPLKLESKIRSYHSHLLIKDYAEQHAHKVDHISMYVLSVTCFCKSYLISLIFETINNVLILFK